MTAFSYGAGGGQTGFFPNYAGGGGAYGAPGYSLSNTYGVGASSTGTAFSGGGAAAGSMAGIYGAIAQGVSSYMDARAEASAIKEQAKNNTKMVKEQANQSRATIGFQAAQGDWSVASDRKRRADALGEHLKVARNKTSSGSSFGSGALASLQRMQATDSPHQMADPGAQPDPRQYDYKGPLGG